MTSLQCYLNAVDEWHKDPTQSFDNVIERHITEHTRNVAQASLNKASNHPNLIRQCEGFVFGVNRECIVDPLNIEI